MRTKEGLEMVPRKFWVSEIFDEISKAFVLKIRVYVSLFSRGLGLGF